MYWELGRSHCLEPPLCLWLYCAAFHELPLWASYHLWEESFHEAILQKGNGGREGCGRAGTGAPKQGLTSEGILGYHSPGASSACSPEIQASPSPCPLPICRPLTVAQAVSHCPGRPPVTNQYCVQPGCVLAQPEATGAFL